MNQLHPLQRAAASRDTLPLQHLSHSPPSFPSPPSPVASAVASIEEDKTHRILEVKEKSGSVQGHESLGQKVVKIDEKSTVNKDSENLSDRRETTGFPSETGEKPQTQNHRPSEAEKTSRAQRGDKDSTVQVSVGNDSTTTDSERKDSAASGDLPKDQRSLHLESGSSPQGGQSERGGERHPGDVQDGALPRPREGRPADATPKVSQNGDPQQSGTLGATASATAKVGAKDGPAVDPFLPSLPAVVTRQADSVAILERGPPQDGMGNRLGGERSKGKKGEKRDGKKEEKREEKRRRRGKPGDKKAKCSADPDSLTTEIEEESSSFGFHSFENLLAGALGASRSPKHRGGASQTSTRDDDHKEEMEWVPMSIEDENGVQFKPDADDSSTASQDYGTPLLATPLMKRSQPPCSTAERLDQLGRSIHDTILANLSDVRVPQDRDSTAALGRTDSMGGSTDTLTLDDQASVDKALSKTSAAAAAAAAVAESDGKTTSGIPSHVLDSRSNGSGSSTPVLRRRRQGSAANSPDLRRRNESPAPSTPVLRRRNEGSGTDSPVLRRRNPQDSAPGTPVLRRRNDTQAPTSPTLSQRHQTAAPGSPPVTPRRVDSGPSSPVLRHRNEGAGPGSPTLRRGARETGAGSPVLPPRHQGSGPSSPLPRRRNEPSGASSPILRLKNPGSIPGSPTPRPKNQSPATGSPVLLRRNEGSAPGSPTLRQRNPGSASNSPVLRARQIAGPSSLVQRSGTQSPSTDSGLSTPASESKPRGKAAGSQSQVSQGSSQTAAPRTYPSNRPLPFPLDVDTLTDLPVREAAAAPCGMSHSLTRPATGPREPMPPPECFHASLPRDSSRDSGLSLARAAPSGDEEWMDEMFYSCQDVSFDKELHEDVVDGEQFLQPASPLLTPPGDSLAAPAVRARGEKAKVVSQYDNVQDADEPAAPSTSLTSSRAGRSARGPEPTAASFDKSQQKTSHPTKQGTMEPKGAVLGLSSAVSPGRGGGEAGRSVTSPRNGASASGEPAAHAVTMVTTSQAPSASAGDHSQKEVTEHNLQLLVRAIEKLPHFDAPTANVRDSLSMDGSQVDGEDSSQTDSSFEDMGLRRIAKCVEVTCAAENKSQSPDSLLKSKIPPEGRGNPRGGNGPTTQMSAPVKASETSVSSLEADTIADKGEVDTRTPEADVPPPSPSALVDLVEVEDDEDEAAMERQEAALQHQRELEARLFGDTVVKRLSSLLDNMEAEEGEVHAADLTFNNSSAPEARPSRDANIVAVAREGTLAERRVGDVAGASPRPTVLSVSGVAPSGTAEARWPARNTVVFSVASVETSRVQSEVVLESSPCVSPTSKPKSAGSVADGDRSVGVSGTSPATGTRQQNESGKTPDSTQQAISLSYAVPIESSIRDNPILHRNNVEGCDSVTTSKKITDNGKHKDENQETENQPTDAASSGGIVKKPSIPDLLITSSAEEAVSTDAGADVSEAPCPEQDQSHPGSKADLPVHFQLGECTHLDPAPPPDKSKQTLSGREKEKEGSEGNEKAGNREVLVEGGAGETTLSATPAPKRESQQIHDVIAAYWGTEETPTDSDSRTLSRSSLGGSSELTGDSRSDTLSAGSRGDRLSVCTADTDSSFDDHVFTGLVFENRTYQGQTRPAGEDRLAQAKPPSQDPPHEAGAVPCIIFENSALKERERPVKIPSLIFGNSSLRAEGAVPGNHCRESSDNSSSEVELGVGEEEEEEEDDEDEDDDDVDSQEDNPSRPLSKRPSTSSVDSASALRVPALEETFGELQGVKTFLEELQERTPTAESLPVFAGADFFRGGGLGALGGAEAAAAWSRRSRMSPSVTERTESDLDASEHRDDISSTGESMYADDEDDGQEFFADDPGSEVMVGCGAGSHSAPEAEGEGDGFWAECSPAEVTYRELETSMDAASTVFRNARRQMHDIHEHLQDLRRQMELLQDDVQHVHIKVATEPDSSDIQPALN